MITLETDKYTYRYSIDLDSFNPSKCFNSGFTLVELVIVIAIIGIIATLAFFGYTGYLDKAKTATALQEINTLEKEISIYSVESNALPPNLAAINYDGFLDPWNRPYVYNPDLTVNPRIDGDTGKKLNDDYDLYSLGKDGLSAQDINDPTSQDDIIRALNGSFKGFGKLF